MEAHPYWTRSYSYQGVPRAKELSQPCRETKQCGIVRCLIVVDIHKRHCRIATRLLQKLLPAALPASTRANTAVALISMRRPKPHSIG